MSYADVEMKIVQWGEARGIIKNGKPIGQAKKTLEEAGELIEATAKLDAIRDVIRVCPEVDIAKINTLIERYLLEAEDAIGDVAVTLIMGCGTMDVGFVECVKNAYDEIKDRKGYLNPQGIFVKES